MTPRRTIYLLILSLSAILGLFAVRWTGLTSVPASEGPSHTPSATTVVLAPVTIDRIRHTIRAVGTLRANESIMIRPEVAGRIRQVWFEEGQAVEKDQLLIELEHAGDVDDGGDVRDGGDLRLEADALGEGGGQAHDAVLEERQLGGRRGFVSR